jgi:dihydroxyacetone kinase-like protein
VAEKFKNSQGKQIVLDLVKVIQDNAQYLSEIDGAIGDGDHGINMNKGFTRCGDILKMKDLDLSSALNILGDVLLNEIGGTLGPLYGTFFIEMGTVCKGQEEIDSQRFGMMLKAGIESIQNLGNAKIGDKTLLDTLLPAYIAYARAIQGQLGFQQALQRLDEAAETGKESTRDLIAKVGRASRLGERSRGVLDAGATSSCMILKSISSSIQQLISE